MRLTNTSLFTGTLNKQEDRINKILENHMDSDDSIRFKAFGISFPPAFLCWLPIIGNLFILFGMKEYIIGVTTQKVILVEVNIKNLSEKSVFELQKQDIVKIETEYEKVSILSSKAKRFVFKEMPSIWARELKKELEFLINQ
ncbi:hypothetical protein [Flagellimonas sp.]|uniref:hypothetical protein n=1 Tax=Flagellimonas sp. TaxID=2058762 RepID=UPI003B5050DD